MLKCSGLDPGIFAAAAWPSTDFSASLATPEGALEVFVDVGPLRELELAPDAADCVASSSSSPSYPSFYPH